MSGTNSETNENCTHATKEGQKSVLAAMSGGVDSSVVCTKLCEAGYSVQGATMLLRDGLNAGNAKAKLPQSQKQDIADARAVCEKLGIAHHTLDFTERFKHSVIEPFCCAYLSGTTPNPCVICNQRMKFKALHQARKDLCLDYLATGHYARIAYDEKKGRYLLKTAADPTKDQSYVLYGLDQEQLAHTLFPLGEQLKTQTREAARKHNLEVADKPESQDICFIPDGDYAAFIEQYVEQYEKENAEGYEGQNSLENAHTVGEDGKTSAKNAGTKTETSTAETEHPLDEHPLGANPFDSKHHGEKHLGANRPSTNPFGASANCQTPGPIVLEDGTQIGTHAGLMHYTTGQRKGICVAWSEPLFVLRKDVENNALVVGTAAQQGISELWAENVNLIALEQIDKPAHVEVKVNYRAQRMPATVEATKDNNLHVIFDKPIKTCAIGQACVLYTDDIVIGGGIISAYV